ncbi:uncharacterized protein LOC107030084 [Solanum pennellii]|uniref:Uncharacterized protein LOC107030084 n=1 Tax=Solanum pennellii TaxID=28526 RepID=A0ABM1HKX1_SOLPN|nr:uncharacterized protein LOC107030084 [Solanum pennellii]
MESSSSNHFMLNTGGAFKTASCALGGIGGVFRNHDGDWILGFSGLVATADALSTELHALLKGLQLALDRHLLPLEINVDAQLLVDLLCLLRRLGDPTVRHVYREQN